LEKKFKECEKGDDITPFDGIQPGQNLLDADSAKCLDPD
jgi:hypothetical protein